MTEKSRLSDLQVEDAIIRSFLYRNILIDIATHKIKTSVYEIKQDELYRPDLVSYRAYGTTELRWLILLLGNVEDEEYPLPVASEIRLPDQQYIREKIRHWSENGALESL